MSILFVPKDGNIFPVILEKEKEEINLVFKGKQSAKIL
jgi:hypothetical protein